MARQDGENPITPAVHARYVAQHGSRDICRLLLHDHLRNRWRLDALIFVEGARLVLRRIRFVLHLVGPDRFSGLVDIRTDRGPVRPATGVLRYVGRRSDLSHTLGLCREQYRVMGVWPAMEHRLSRLL